MQVAQGLGWFSIGLGLAQILAPGGIAKLTGVPERRGLIRLMGMREIASGLGIFSQRRPSPALWSRVVGDVMDLSLLSTALKSKDSSRPRIAATLAAVAGVTALDVYSSQQISRNAQAQHAAQKV